MRRATGGRTGARANRPVAPVHLACRPGHGGGGVLRPASAPGIPGRLGSIELDRLEQIVAAFANPEVAVDVAIDDLAGHRLVGVAAPSDGMTDPRLERVLRIGDRAVATIVAWGPDAGTPTFRASFAALAEAVATLVGQPSSAASDPRLELELAHGRRLQRSFVSLVAPEVPGYEIASHYEAAREIGGDFFDLFRRRRRRRPLSIVIADVTGKGIAAALLMAFSRPLLHAAIDNTRGPVEALERTNTILVQERHSSLFITALCAELDLPTGLLRVASAGHEPPLLVPGDGSGIRPIESSGVMLGAFETIDAVEGKATLQPGDAVVFYTDGATDATDPAGERFGDARLRKAIVAGRSGGPTSIVQTIRARIEAFQGAAECSDDVTLVCIGRRAV